jgi:hypothetical protein
MPKSGPRVEPDELEQRALTLRTIGWMLLIFDVSIITVFVFVGFRSGSWLWLYWTVIQGAVGMGLVAAGMYQESVASELTGEEAEPHTEAGDTERAA